jgi:hypothetical protein
VLSNNHSLTWKNLNLSEKLEHTKGILSTRKSKDIQDHGEGYTRPWWNGKDERTMKNRRLKIDQHSFRTRVELMCSGSVSSSCSTSGNRRVTVVVTSVINTSWLFLFYRSVQYVYIYIIMDIRTHAIQTTLIVAVQKEQYKMWGEIWRLRETTVILQSKWDLTRFV